MNTMAGAFLNFMSITGDEIIRSRYTASLLTFIIFFIVAYIVSYIAKKVILSITAKTKIEIDDLIVKNTNKPISLLLLLLGVKLAIIPLELTDKVNAIAHHTITTLAIIVITYILIVVFSIMIMAWAKRLAEKTKSKADNQIVKISEKTTKIIVITLALLFILQVWGIQMGPLLASLGIIGIAVAFGLQSTLGNIFGGISMILDRSIRVGDVVKLDDGTASEISGTVIDVGLRSTKIKTWNNEVVVVPNGVLANQRIKNYVLPDATARIVVPFSVAYGSNIDKVKKIVMGEIKKLDNLNSKEESQVMFLEMGPSSLNFQAWVYITHYEDRFATKEKLNCMIYNALNKNKITIPFPQMDVYIKQHAKGKK